MASQAAIKTSALSRMKPSDRGLFHGRTPSLIRNPDKLRNQISIVWRFETRKGCPRSCCRQNNRCESGKKKSNRDFAEIFSYDIVEGIAGDVRMSDHHGRKNAVDQKYRHMEMRTTINPETLSIISEAYAQFKSFRAIPPNVLKVNSLHFKACCGFPCQNLFESSAVSIPHKVTTF
jgi:hypothetical protein